MSRGSVFDSYQSLIRGASVGGGVVAHRVADVALLGGQLGIDGEEVAGVRGGAAGGGLDHAVHGRCSTPAGQCVGASGDAQNPANPGCRSRASTSAIGTQASSVASPSVGCSVGGWPDSVACTVV